MLTRSDVDSILEQLKDKMCFASEAQFQLEFALACGRLFAGSQLLLEWPESNLNKRYEYDLIVCGEKGDTLIEFKYKVANKSDKGKRIAFPIGGSNGLTVKLPNQGAYDEGAYHCWRDIEKIENWVAKNNNRNGFFILITNEEHYWTNSFANGIARDVSMEGGKHQGYCSKKLKGDRYNNGRWPEINILSDYNFEYNDFWRNDFVIPGKTKKEYGLFKCLVVEVLLIFFITKDNPDGTRETVKTIYGPIEEAKEEFKKIIEEQYVDYHKTKTLDHWRVIRLFDVYGNQLAQES